MSLSSLNSARENGRGYVHAVSDSELRNAANIASQHHELNAFVLSRIEIALHDRWRMSGGLWGFYTPDGLDSLLYVGANIVPVLNSPFAKHEFARELRNTGRRSSSILGPQSDVLGIWELMGDSWGRPREIRSNQPFLRIDHSPAGERDNRVVVVTRNDLTEYLPASISMFTEEVGASPVANGGEPQYRRRVEETIDMGHAFAIFEGRQVIFKAEVGFTTSQCAQLQGVWVAPHVRGLGIAARALRTVIDQIQRSISPVVTLYVNDFNIPARRAYASVGFIQQGTFATVLF